ncbi:uncharacterized protein VP01_9955g1 [Puccinia sorghi]|uniref:Uncharacterized protein n=1 Tax=Puccinia sorghi TaxID=27349 RepID=A0A0L6U7A8_9BASI|nr:uncharacterized protein VP01_9955g1 [Puccinia sorghi]
MVQRGDHRHKWLFVSQHFRMEWNYNSCFGKGKAPALGHPAKGKINGFEMMAINICTQSPQRST